jgi:hypothetical protein
VVQTSGARADRPEASVNIGNLCLIHGEVARAEHAYHKAIALDPHFCQRA